MNVIESIRNFIKTCPYLQDYLGATAPKVNVDYLDNEVISYSIQRVPANPVIKTYINGDKKKQEVFVFCSRESYGEDVFNNLENIGFYENFARWIEEQNRLCNFPLLDKNCEVEKIELTTNGYAFQTDLDKAQYQIQMKLIYIEKGSR